MTISLLAPECVKDNKGGWPVYIQADATFDNLVEIIPMLQEHHIAISQFTNGYRRGADWLATDWLAVDFDDGVLSKDIHDYLVQQNLNHLIMASKNHLRDKGDGKGVVERYHVFIPFSQRITQDTELYSYVATCFIKDHNWKVDLAVTKDKCRYYFKHRESLYVCENAQPLNIAPYIESRKKILEIQRTAKQKIIVKGKSWKSPAFLKTTKYWKSIVSDLRTVGLRHNTAKKAFWFLLGHGINKWDAVNMVLTEMCPSDIIDATKNLNKLYDWQESHYGRDYLV